MTGERDALQEQQLVETRRPGAHTLDVVHAEAEADADQAFASADVRSRAGDPRRAKAARDARIQARKQKAQRTNERLRRSRDLQQAKALSSSQRRKQLQGEINAAMGSSTAVNAINRPCTVSVTLTAQKPPSKV